MVEKIDRVIDSTAKKADQVKAQTATALEDAARKLREVDISGKSEDVKRILHDVEERVSRLSEEVGAEYQKMDTEYRKRVEPIETIISDHPIPAVLAAVGFGMLIGALIFKSRE